MNVVTDVARCRRCGEVFPLSMLVQTTLSGPPDLENPPRGAWYREELEGFTVGATTRHPIALFLVPFMCIWSGGSLGGIYGTQIIQGKFNLWTSLFGAPFVFGTILFGSLALMAMCGRVVVRVCDGAGTIFTGVGPFGTRRSFDAHEVKAVRIEPHHTGNRAPTLTIVLDGPHRVRFGSMLNEERRDFIAKVLRAEILNRKRPVREIW